jgi:hypothetical protein
MREISMTFWHLGLSALLAVTALPASAGPSELYQLGRGAGDLLPTAINLRADDHVAHYGVDSTFLFNGASAMRASRVSRAKAVRLYFSGMTVEAVPKAEPYALAATARGLTKFIALPCRQRA